MQFQNSFSSMKSTRNSAYSQETAGRMVNCRGDNESISMIEYIFHNVTAFCLSKSTLFTLPWDFNGPTYSLWNCPSVLPGFCLAGVSSQQLHNNSSQLSCTQEWTESQEELGFWHLLQHRVYSVFTKLCLNTTATIRPSPLIPATHDSSVHNKSITHSFKMKIKRASD